MANGPGLLLPLGLNLDVYTGKLGPGLTLALALNLDTSAAGTLGPGLLLPLGMNLHVSNPGGGPVLTDVYISWAIPTNNTDGTVLTDLLGFQVWYGQTTGVYSNLLTVADPTATFAVVEDLPPGTWYFNTRAYTATAQSAFASELAIVLSGTVTVELPLQCTYSIVSGVSRDYQSTYTVNLSTPVEADYEPQYEVLTAVSPDLVASWFITTVPAAAWFARLTGGFATWASLGSAPVAAAQNDLAASYIVAGAVSADLSALYELSQAGVIDGGGPIPLSVVQTLAPLYEIFNAPQANLVAQWNMIAPVERDLFGGYSIDAGLPPVESDFTVIWSFSTPVEADFVALYDVKVTVQQDLAPQYQVLSAVQQDFTATYSGTAGVSQDLAALYDVTAVLNTPFLDYAATWTVFVTVENDLVPIWSAAGFIERDYAAQWNVVKQWSKKPKVPKPWTSVTADDIWTPAAAPDDVWVTAPTAAVANDFAASYLVE